MRLLIATDAWRPQVNGVVRTLNMQEKQQPYPFGLAGFKDAYEGPGLDPNAPPPGTGASALRM